MKHFFYLHWQSAKSAFLHLLKYPFSSLLNLLILSIALTLPLSLHLTVISLQNWANRLYTIPQISLFMELSTEDADLVGISSTLRKHPKVQSYQLVSKQQALQALEQRDGLQYGNLGHNPLPDVFIVAPNTLDPKELDILQKELSGLPMVSMAQFDTHWAKRLFSLVKLGEKLTIFLSVALSIALILITHNTIRLQILARRDEIEVSKLIGAPDNFIRRPFIHHALWQGVLAALIAWGVTSWLVRIAAPALADIAQLFDKRIELRGLNISEIIITIVCAATLTMAGARIATNHHLRQHDSP